MSTLDTKALRPALPALSGAISNKPTLPILSHALVTVAHESIRFAGYDLENAVSLTIPTPPNGPTAGAVCVPWSLLKSALSGPAVDLNASDPSRLTVDAGMLSRSFDSLPVDDYPDTPALCTVPYLTLPGVTLYRHLSALIMATAREASRAFTSGIFFSAESALSGAIVATDGRRLHVITSPQYAALPCDLLLPARGVEKCLLPLLKITPGDVTITTSPIPPAPLDRKGRPYKDAIPGSPRLVTASGVTSSGVAWTVTLHTLDAQFPDYQKVIPRHSHSTSRYTLDAAPALALLKSLAPVYRQKEQRDMVLLTATRYFEENTPERFAADLSAGYGDTSDNRYRKTPDTSHPPAATAPLSILPIGSTQPSRIALNGDYLADLFEASRAFDPSPLTARAFPNAPVLAIDASSDPVTLTVSNPAGETFRGVLMPVRLLD